MMCEVPEKKPCAEPNPTEEWLAAQIVKQEGEPNEDEWNLKKTNSFKNIINEKQL